MPNFTGLQLHQHIKLLEGPTPKRELPFTDEEQEKFDSGNKVETKRVPLDVKHALITLLNADLSIKTQQSYTADPHEDKKVRMYEMKKELLACGNSAEEFVKFDSKEVTMLKERAQKVFGLDIFGFIYDVLEGNNTFGKVPAKEDRIDHESAVN